MDQRFQRLFKTALIRDNMSTTVVALLTIEQYNSHGECFSARNRKLILRTCIVKMSSRSYSVEVQRKNYL